MTEIRCKVTIQAEDSSMTVEVVYHGIVTKPLLNIPLKIHPSELIKYVPMDLLELGSFVIQKKEGGKT